MVDKGVLSPRRKPLALKRAPIGETKLNDKKFEDDVRHIAEQQKNIREQARKAAEAKTLKENKLKEAKNEERATYTKTSITLNDAAFTDLLLIKGKAGRQSKVSYRVVLEWALDELKKMDREQIVKALKPFQRQTRVA